MNLGLCPGRVERYHLLRMDTNTMPPTSWFHDNRVSGIFPFSETARSCLGESEES